MTLRYERLGWTWTNQPGGNEGRHNEQHLQQKQSSAKLTTACSTFFNWWLALSDCHALTKTRVPNKTWWECLERWSRWSPKSRGLSQVLPCDYFSRSTVYPCLPHINSSYHIMSIPVISYHYSHIFPYPQIIYHIHVRLKTHLRLLNYPTKRSYSQSHFRKSPHMEFS